MGNLTKALILLDTDGTVKKQPPIPYKFSHRACLLHQQQQCITAYVLTCKSNSGRELVKPCEQKNVDGRPVMDCWTFKSNSGRELVKPCEQKNVDGRPVMDCFFLS